MGESGALKSGQCEWLIGPGVTARFAPLTLAAPVDQSTHRGIGNGAAVDTHFHSFPVCLGLAHGFCDQTGLQ